MNLSGLYGKYATRGQLGGAQSGAASSTLASQVAACQKALGPSRGLYGDVAWPAGCAGSVDVRLPTCGSPCPLSCL